MSVGMEGSGPNPRTYSQAEYSALEAENARLERLVSHWQGLAVTNRKVADDTLAQLAAIQGGMGEVVGFDRNVAYAACPESGCDWGSFYVGWKAAAAQHQRILAALAASTGQEVGK